MQGNVKFAPVCARTINVVQDVKLNVLRRVHVLFKLTVTQRLVRGWILVGQECLARNKNTEGRGSAHRDVLQKEGGKLECPTRVRRGQRAPWRRQRRRRRQCRCWCWRRKCYFFGTLSDRSKDIRRYSWQNVAETGRQNPLNEQRTVVQKFGRAYCQREREREREGERKHGDETSREKSRWSLGQRTEFSRTIARIVVPGISALFLSSRFCEDPPRWRNAILQSVVAVSVTLQYCSKWK